MKQKHIYEVIRYQEGVGLFLEDHLERLTASLRNSLLTCDLTVDEINRYYEKRKNMLLSPVNMRIDVREGGYEIHFRPPIMVTQNMYREGKGKNGICHKKKSQHKIRYRFLLCANGAKL